MAAIGDGNNRDPLKAYSDAKTQGHKYVLFVDDNGNIGSRANRTPSLFNFFAAIADLFSGNTYKAKVVAQKLKERFVTIIIPDDRSLKTDLSKKLENAETALEQFKTSLSKQENKGKYNDAIPLLDEAIASVKEARRALNASSPPASAPSSPPPPTQGNAAPRGSRPVRADSVPVLQTGTPTPKDNKQPSSTPASLPGTRSPSPSSSIAPEPRGQRAQSVPAPLPTTSPAKPKDRSTSAPASPTASPPPSKEQQVADKVRKQNEQAARMGDALSNTTREETTQVTPALVVATPETPPTDKEIETFVKEYADAYIQKGHSDCSYRSHATVSHQANSNAPSIRCVAITFGYL
jgi:hypothetical protein